MESAVPPLPVPGRSAVRAAVAAMDAAFAHAAEPARVIPRLLSRRLTGAPGTDDEALLAALGTDRGWTGPLRDTVDAVLGAELSRRLAEDPAAVDAWLCGLAMTTADLGRWLDAVDAGPLALRVAAHRFRAWARAAGAVGRSPFWRGAPDAASVARSWVARREPTVLAEDPGYYAVLADQDGGLTIVVDRERGAGVVETRRRAVSDAEAAAVWAGDESAARALADALWW